jgi:hypothetical protein
MTGYEFDYTFAFKFSVTEGFLLVIDYWHSQVNDDPRTIGAKFYTAPTDLFGPTMDGEFHGLFFIIEGGY